MNARIPPQLHREVQLCRKGLGACATTAPTRRVVSLATSQGALTLLRFDSSAATAA